MRQFLLMTKRGKTPPSYVYSSLDSALTEAKRLSEVYSEEVTILEIVGVVKQVDVPVTRRETKVVLKEGIHNEDDDLPF